jgi:thiosulfate/3-mercaptopyruvate sulfurtransferase
LTDPKVRIVEVDYDPTSNYNQGHIPGAVLFDWKKDINDPVRRDIVSREQLEELLSRNGVGNDTTLLLYGDFNNWFAAFAFWVLKYYGFKDVRIINGGRKKWIEEDKPLTKERPSFASREVQLSNGDDSIRAYLEDVRRVLGKVTLVDVRSPKEFSGEVLAPPEYPTEHAQRGGHIPGAVNIPWAQAVREDGTFKSPEELAALYQSKGVTGEKDVIAYCRIGERSSHTWFVLTYLLGYPKVKNYDGSWTEWGNLVRSPVEK